MNRGDVEAFAEHYWKSDDLTFSSGGAGQDRRQPGEGPSSDRGRRLSGLPLPGGAVGRAWIVVQPVEESYSVHGRGSFSRAGDEDYARRGSSRDPALAPTRTHAARWALRKPTTRPITAAETPKTPLTMRAVGLSASVKP